MGVVGLATGGTNRASSLSWTSRPAPWPTDGSSVTSASILEKAGGADETGVAIEPMPKRS